MARAVAAADAAAVCESPADAAAAAAGVYESPADAAAVSKHSNAPIELEIIPSILL